MNMLVVCLNPRCGEDTMFAGATGNWRRTTARSGMWMLMDFAAARDPRSDIQDRSQRGIAGFLFHHLALVDFPAQRVFVTPPDEVVADVPVRVA